MKTPLHFQLYKKYLIALAVAGVFLLAGYLFARHFTISSKKEKNFEKLEFSPIPSIERTATVLSEFDPNSLTEVQWQKLGFSKQQTTTIMKYKNVVGGKFSSKEQFQKCYAVSPEKYRELEPFILLPEKKTGFTQHYSTPERKKFSKKMNISQRFNPDLYELQDWVRVGFSERQAEAILKYRKYLGGSFQSKVKFSECFVISEDQYNQLHPYLLLPETTKSPENRNFTLTEKARKVSLTHNPFNPNDLDLEGWIKLGFSEKQAQVILNYKSKVLKGSFKTPEDLAKCFVVSEEKYQELKPFIKLQTDTETRSENKNSESVSSGTDFSTIDLNNITFHQLKEFGFDEKAAVNLLGFRKKLGGFAYKKQILETYNINLQLAEKLIATTLLNSGEITKYKLSEAPENWLKEHPYFRYYADKIIFYRITYPQDKKIFKLLKAKPEAETKMKLYLLP